MINYNVESDIRPASVAIIDFDGRRSVTMTDEPIEIEDEETGRTYYKYNEVTFDLPDDRTEGAGEIEANFDDWWAYGAQPPEDPPTLEQRVSELEEIVIDLIGGDL